MDIGVMIFPTDLSIRPAELAVAVEERGFASLFVTEHTHIPTSRRSPWPGGPNLPEEYRRTLDPFVALTAAASVTSRIKVGTGICLVAQHDPIVLAKTIASLDLVSNGRFVFGIGVGWNVEEMVDHGVDPARRRSIAREKVLAMKALWSQDEASFDGKFVRFEPAWAWPKPVQRPHPPVLMGGAGGPVTFRHIVEYCDGWMPIAGRAPILEKITELRRTAEDAGRDPASLQLHVFGSPDDKGTLEQYEAAGIQSVLVRVPPKPAADVLPVLDRYAALLPG